MATSNRSVSKRTATLADQTHSPIEFDNMEFGNKLLQLRSLLMCMYGVGVDCSKSSVAVTETVSSGMPQTAQSPWER